MCLFSNLSICRNINEDTIVHQRYEPPTRPVPPPGVEDFDLLNWNDPNQCSEYAMDIFYYYKNREVWKTVLKSLISTSLSMRHFGVIFKHCVVTI